VPGSTTPSNAQVSLGSVSPSAGLHRSAVHPGVAPSEAPGGWCRRGLAGRLTELSIAPGSASLTLACSLILDAQQEGEPAAWVMGREHTFFPPDLAAWGVDLDALAVVRCAAQRVPSAPPGKPRMASPVARAADRLARSGAFGLIILDLSAGVRPTGGRPAGPHVPMPLQSRLLGLAIKHDIALLCLTDGAGRGEAQGAPRGNASLGSLVSLRAESIHRRVAEGRFTAGLRVTKDKRRAPGWAHLEECCGPPGLR